MKSFHNVKSQGLLKKYEEKQTKFEERWEDINRLTYHAISETDNLARQAGRSAALGRD